MKQLTSALTALCGVLLLASCQAVFTYSPVEFLERDLAKLSDEQQLDRAEDVLVAGTTEEIIEAYDAVVALIDAGDVSSVTHLLAADLAFAASGIMDVVADVLADTEILSTATAEDIEALFASFDITYVESGAEYIQGVVDAAEAAGEEPDVSSTQYIIAGAVLFMSAVEQADGFENAADYDEYDDALNFLAAAGIDDIEDLFSF